MAKNSDIDLSIPWCLDVRNPKVAAQRAKAAEEFKQEKRAASKPKASFAPAKSVATDPTAKEEPKVVKETKAPATKAKAAKANEADDLIIRVLVDDFGHKPGSKAETKSAAFKNGMTVADYMADDLGFAGNWHKSHIKHCVDKGFIKLEG